MNKYIAEMFGTFWLVLGGCGSAVLAAGFPDVGIGLLGVALAFGLTVLTMAFAIGHISGCHLNPAVTVGLWVGGRFSAKDVIPYIVFQVIGGVIAAAILYVIASGQASFDVAASGFAANGFGDHGCYRQSRAAGFCAYRNRLVPDFDSLNQHSCHQHIRQPSTQYCGRIVRR